MPLTLEIEVQGCEQADINVTQQFETLTLEIIDAPVPSGVSIDDAAGLGDTGVTWSADKSSRELADKVDAEAGKQLSDENYTLAEKQKLGGIADEATKNRDDSENADKIHGHTISDVTGLSTRLNDIDSLIGDVEAVLIAINGEP